MTIETDLYSTLVNDAGVAAITSEIHFGVAREDAALPTVVMSLIVGDKIDTLPGTGDMDRKVMQISCFAETYSAAKTLADAVIAALEGDGYKQNETDIYDPNTKTHGVYVDWSFLA